MVSTTKRATYRAVAVFMGIAITAALTAALPGKAHAVAGPRADSGYIQVWDNQGYKRIFEMSGAKVEAVAGLTYDAPSNTLILQNYNNKSANLRVCDMGDDFKIRVEGSNSIHDIDVSTDDGHEGYLHGSGLKITGAGSLIVDPSSSSNATSTKTAIRLYGGYTDARLIVEPTVKLSLSGEEYSLVSVSGTTNPNSSEAITILGDATIGKRSTSMTKAGSGVYGKSFNALVYDETNLLELNAGTYQGKEYGVMENRDRAYLLHQAQLDGNTVYLAQESTVDVGAIAFGSGKVEAYGIVEVIDSGVDMPIVDGKEPCAAWNAEDRSKSYTAVGPYEWTEGKCRWRLFEVMNASVQIDGSYYYLEKTLPESWFEGDDLAPFGYKTNRVKWPDYYTHNVSGPSLTQGLTDANNSSSGSGSSGGANASAVDNSKKTTNPMKVKAIQKSLKASVLKKKSVALTGVIKFTQKAIGKVTYTRIASGSSKWLSVEKSGGKVTVKKGAPKGTLKMKVNVKAAGNKSYKSIAKQVVVKVVVR